MIQLQRPQYAREMLSGLLLAATKAFGAAAARQGKCPNLGKAVFDGVEKSEPGVGGNRRLKRQFYKGVFTNSRKKSVLLFFLTGCSSSLIEAAVKSIKCEL